MLRMITFTSVCNVCQSEYPCSEQWEKHHFAARDYAHEIGHLFQNGLLSYDACYWLIIPIYSGRWYDPS